MALADASHFDRLVDFLYRATGDVAGVVDEDVDVGRLLGQPRDILALAQVDDMGVRVDLMRRSQAIGQRLQLVAAAGGQSQVTALFGKGFGRSGADAL